MRISLILFSLMFTCFYGLTQDCPEELVNNYYKTIKDIESLEEVIDIGYIVIDKISAEDSVRKDSTLIFSLKMKVLDFEMYQDQLKEQLDQQKPLLDCDTDVKLNFLKSITSEACILENEAAVAELKESYYQLFLLGSRARGLEEYTKDVESSSSDEFDHALFLNGIQLELEAEIELQKEHLYQEQSDAFVRYNCYD